ARKLLDLLYSFTDESAAEYNSYVYATYSVLHTADQERNEFVYNAFLTAYDNTIKLVDELKNLYHNIRRYHQNLNDYATANQVLQGHFDEYKVLLMDRIYHPLKTLDAVPRFKMPILQIINAWLEDRSIRDRIAEQALLRGKYQSEEEAAEDIILKLSEISDMYEGMDHMLEEIDKKNAAYTRASIEKMQYLLNTDRSIKGKLTELLMATASIENEGLKERMGEAVRLSRQGYLSEASLFVRRSRARIRSQKPMELAQTGENFAAEEMADFIDRARKLYGNKRVLGYMNTLLSEKDSVESKEIALNNDEEFILLMLGALKRGEKGVPYDVRFSEGYVDSGGYRIPEMCISRKKEKGPENHVEGTI
ncbi:MAG: DUF5716 family protein, partial [Bacillota bacterium]|nr:DUF5716 family protein [Bacillota bacterium]